MRNDGTRERPSLKVLLEKRRADSPTRDMATDRPGRLESMGRGPRSAVEETDLHQQAEDAFLGEIAGVLEQQIATGEVKSLVVAAPPRALGALRKRYSGPLRRAIRAEIDRDYVNAPVADLERHFHRAASG
jgi:protein required for attachment to host cells